MLGTALVTLFAVAAPLPAAPVDTTDLVDSSAVMDSLRRAADAKLHWLTGRVTVKGGMATLDLPAGFRYLDAKDAQFVLNKVWRNPPDESTLGLIFPAGYGPYSDGAWAVEVSFDEDGYVKDDEAATLDYTALLKQMQQSTKEANEERAKQGYATVELLGWAEPPHYDRDSHKLYWAKRAQFSNAKRETLNYNIRALGRRGVLVLNAIAEMDQIDSVKAGMPQVLAAVEFTGGNRYADFDASHGDKIAEYGIAALIAGGVAAKAGIFKVLIGLLIAAKKVIILAAAGLMAWLRKIMGRKKETTWERPPAG